MESLCTEGIYSTASHSVWFRSGVICAESLWSRSPSWRDIPHAQIELWNHNFNFDHHHLYAFHSSYCNGILEDFTGLSSSMSVKPLLGTSLSSPPFSLQCICCALMWRYITLGEINELPLPYMPQDLSTKYHALKEDD